MPKERASTTLRIAIRASSSGVGRSSTSSPASQTSGNVDGGSGSRSRYSSSTFAARTAAGSGAGTIIEPRSPIGQG